VALALCIVERSSIKRINRVLVASHSQELLRDAEMSVRSGEVESSAPIVVCD
jgi:hypothetical protein